jgi:hypothetical protein
LIASVLAKAGTKEMVSVAAVQAAVDMAAAVTAVAAATAAAVVEVALVPRAVAPAAHQCLPKSSVLAWESSNFSMAKKVLASFR